MHQSVSIPCKSISRNHWIEPLRPEGLNAALRRVLFLKGPSSWRVFFCVPNSGFVLSILSLGSAQNNKRVRMFDIVYEAPQGSLSRLVSTFYRVDYAGEAFAEIERADRAQFRFQLSGAGAYEFAAGHTVIAAPVTIIGPTTAPVTATNTGRLQLFGWGMTPSGWAALMGKDAPAYVDTAFDARQIFGDSIMDIHARLADAPDFQTQLAIGEQAASQIYRNSGSAPFEFTAIVDAWLLANIDPDVDLLVEQTGLSPRQLERTTKRFYGMPPKKLARKYRALRAAQALSQGDSLDDSAIGLAFYDQSHLIREVKQFTGLTPSELRSGKSQLTRATMEGRRALGTKVSGLISES